MNNVVWACRYRGGQESSSSSSDSEDDPGYATFQTWNKSDIKMADMQHVDDDKLQVCVRVGLERGERVWDAYERGLQCDIVPCDSASQALQEEAERKARQYEENMYRNALEEQRTSLDDRRYSPQAVR